MTDNPPPAYEYPPLPDPFLVDQETQKKDMELAQKEETKGLPAPATLSFTVKMNEPLRDAAFLSKAAAQDLCAPQSTEEFFFSVSGSKSSIPKILPFGESVSVEIPLPESLTNESKIIVQKRDQAVAINGIMGSVWAAEGCEYLRTMISQPDDMFMMDMKFSKGEERTTLCFTNVNVDRPIQLKNRSDEDKRKLNEALKVLQRSMSESYWLATGVPSMVQNVEPNHFGIPSSDASIKNLTKFSCGTLVGIDGQRIECVHANLDTMFPFPLESLDALFREVMLDEHLPGGLRTREYNGVNQYETMVTAGLDPMEACKHADHVSFLLSKIVCYLLPYRSDGYSALKEDGSLAFVSAEKWEREHFKKALGDCENGAKIMISMMNTIKQEAQTIVSNKEKYKHLLFIHNAIVPFYSWGLGIVAAGSAEATATVKKSGCGSHLNGHAIGLLLPHAHILKALRQGDNCSVRRAILDEEGNPNEELCFQRGDINPTPVNKNPGQAFADRKRALFPGDYEDKLFNISSMLQPLAVEGTTPTPGELCSASDCDTYGAGGLFVGINLASGLGHTDCAVALMGPSVGRVLMMLGAADHVNRFYHKFVEFHLPASNPLYTDAKLRTDNNAAASFIFANSLDVKQAVRSHPLLSNRGIEPAIMPVLPDTFASPFSVKYVMVPHCTYDTKKADLIDYACAVAAEDYSPVEKRTKNESAFAMDAIETGNFERSLAALRATNDVFERRWEGYCPLKKQLHSVEFLLSYHAMINNPYGVEEMLERLKECAHDVSIFGVDSESTIERFFEDDQGAPRALFVRICVDFLLEYGQVVDAKWEDY